MADYRLKVVQVEQVCLFELTWEAGRQLAAKLPYPQQLEKLYAIWQRAYSSYYQSALRGRVVCSGQAATQVDWHSRLVQAEATLLFEFHLWLRSAALFEIRREISRGTIGNTDLLIACDAPDLSRLPWESWEISAEFGTSHPLRIARLPVNVRRSAAIPHKSGKARILVILGDDTGLDFSAELAAIASLHRLADVEVVGWQPGVEIDRLKYDICKTIQTAAGWDSLLFFGHSNEANAVGGQIAIAPNETLSIRELTPYLQRAKARGLRFALFNSCQGLDIASALIDLGINQVAIMREPIHNRVAQAFLLQFLQSLTQFDDVHTALRKASQSLRLESNLTYPSAHLVPSLFRHSGSELFRLQPVGWRTGLRAVVPQKRWQVAALSVAAGLSFLSPVSNWLIGQRLRSQAIYVDVTGQLLTTPPPVVLVQIDRESIRRGLPSGEPYPMDRAYLAQIVDKLSALDAKIIGIDYLLDRPQAGNDARLANALSQAAERGSTLVFGAVLEAGVEVGVRKELASDNWSMQGYTNMPRWYLRVLPYERACTERCPFSYLLALTQKTQQSAAIASSWLSIESETNLRQTLLSVAQEQTQDVSLQRLYRLRLSPWTSLSRAWRQRWFQPLLDFSLPPEQIYSRLSAYRLLEIPEAQLRSQFDWQNQVVIVAAGGYGEAGTDFFKDHSALPPAVAYWRRSSAPSRFTGGEANAYSVHHFLRQHYAVPIPDILLAMGSAIASAALIWLFHKQQLTLRQRQITLCLLSLSYSWLGLQVYASAAVLLPWLLPTATVWIYCLPSLKRSS